MNQRLTKGNGKYFHKLKLLIKKQERIYYKTIEQKISVRHSQLIVVCKKKNVSMLYSTSFISSDNYLRQGLS